MDVYINRKYHIIILAICLIIVFLLYFCNYVEEHNKYRDATLYGRKKRRYSSKYLYKNVEDVMNNYYAVLEKWEDGNLYRESLYIKEKNKLSALLALKQQYSKYIVIFITEV